MAEPPTNADREERSGPLDRFIDPDFLDYYSRIEATRREAVERAAEVPPYSGAAILALLERPGALPRGEGAEAPVERADSPSPPVESASVTDESTADTANGTTATLEVDDLSPEILVAHRLDIEPPGIDIAAWSTLLVERGDQQDPEIIDRSAGLMDNLPADAARPDAPDIEQDAEATTVDEPVTEKTAVAPPVEDVAIIEDVAAIWPIEEESAATPFLAEATTVDEPVTEKTAVAPPVEDVAIIEDVAAIWPIEEESAATPFLAEATTVDEPVTEKTAVAPPVEDVAIIEDVAAPSSGVGPVASLDDLPWDTSTEHSLPRVEAVDEPEQVAAPNTENVEVPHEEASTESSTQSFSDDRSPIEDPPTHSSMPNGVAESTNSGSIVIVEATPVPTAVGDEAWADPVMPPVWEEFATVRSEIDPAGKQPAPAPPQAPTIDLEAGRSVHSGDVARRHDSPDTRDLPGIVFPPGAAGLELPEPFASPVVELPHPPLDLTTPTGEPRSAKSTASPSKRTPPVWEVFSDVLHAGAPEVASVPPAPINSPTIDLHDQTDSESGSAVAAPTIPDERELPGIVFPPGPAAAVAPDNADVQDHESDDSAGITFPPGPADVPMAGAVTPPPTLDIGPDPDAVAQSRSVVAPPTIDLAISAETKPIESDRRDPPTIALGEPPASQDDLLSNAAAEAASTPLPGRAENIGDDVESSGPAPRRSTTGVTSGAKSSRKRAASSQPRKSGGSTDRLPLRRDRRAEILERLALGPASAQELAEGFGISREGVLRWLRLLEADGTIRSTASARTSRVNKWVLVENGDAVHESTVVVGDI